MKRPEGKLPFLFVEYKTIKEADMAIAKYNGKRVGGRPIFVKYGKPRTQRDGQEKRGFGSSHGDQRGNDRSSGYGNIWQRDEKADHFKGRQEKSGGFHRDEFHDNRKGGFPKGNGEHQKRDGYQKKDEYQRRDRSPQTPKRSEPKPKYDDFDY